MQEGDEAGLAQGEHPFAFDAVGFGLLGSSVDASLGQAGEVGFILDDELVASVFLQQIVAELQAQSRELFVDFAQFLLLVGGQGGAVAHKVLFVLLDHANLLVVEAHFVAVLIDIVDALEEFRVHHNAVAVFGKQRQHCFGDFHHLVVGEAFVEVEEHVANAVQGLARLVEGQDGVLESGRLGIADDGFHFGQLFFHTRLKSRQIVLVLDLVERRHLEGCGVFREERIFRLGLCLRLVFRGARGQCDYA